jgi:predicted CXXCH cytochrome family protein
VARQSRFHGVSRFGALALLFGLLIGSVAHAGDPPGGRVPKPVIEPARGGQCVEDPAFMRRNHMELLKHQRDDTLRGGVRITAKYSLKACIECHASPASNSVTATQTNFCVSCHSYAAVKIDCFECHATQPQKTSFLPLVHPAHAGSAAQLGQQLRQQVAQQQVKP